MAALVAGAPARFGHSMWDAVSASARRGPFYDEKDGAFGSRAERSHKENGSEISLNHHYT